MGLNGGVPKHFWSPPEDGKAALPWLKGEWVAIDACGRMQPQSQKVECYSKHNRPHPVPPQEAVDASWEDVFKRNELDKRLNNVLLCVDGRATTLSSTRSTTSSWWPTWLQRRPP